MITHACISMSLCVLSLLGGKITPEAVRPMAAVGSFYPADSTTLRETVEGLFAKAQTSPPPARLLACVSPCSAYGFSGAVAAHAFKDLSYGQYERVIVLAGSHHARFEGCSIAATQAYFTPLGIVPLDMNAVSLVCRSTLIDQRTLRYTSSKRRVMLHENEHSIEVVLPFLQARLGEFKLVPILVGQFVDAKGQFNEKAIEGVVDTLRHIMDEQTLVVVSTDFTHFGNDFSFRPFQDQIPERIKALDNRAFDYLMRVDFAGFRGFLQESGTPICGDSALLLLLKLLPKRAQGVLLDYDQSMRMTGSKERSVSYAALQFYDPGRAPLPGKPRPLPLSPPASPGGKEDASGS